MDPQQELFTALLLKIKKKNMRIRELVCMIHSYRQMEPRILYLSC